VERWYSGSAYQLAEIHFANGTVWTKADANAIAAGTSAPFSSSAAPSSGRPTRIANENDPEWISAEDWANLQGKNDSGTGGAGTGGKSGGCAAGAMPLAVFALLALAVPVLMSAKRKR
jgi:hypothetical protein